MTNNNNFTSPFALLEKQGLDHFRRVNLIVDRENTDMLMRIRLRPTGVISTTFCLLYDKLIRELKTRGITGPEQHDQFIDFVLRSELHLPEERSGGEPIPNSTASGTVPQAQTPDDRSRATPGHSSVKRTEDEPPCVQPPSGGVRGGRSGKTVEKRKGV